MRLRFKSALGFIFLLIAICAFLGVGYIFYGKISNDSDIVVDGKITINYLTGKKFELNGNNEVSFSVQIMILKHSIKSLIISTST